MLQKGAQDVIATDTTEAGSSAAHDASKIAQDEPEQSEAIVVDVPGGLKRCGGQGDILSGSVGAFLAFGKCFESGAYGDGSIPPSRMPVLAATAASILTRTTSSIAFEREGRSVVTQDMLQDIGQAFRSSFGEEAQGSKL